MLSQVSEVYQGMPGLTERIDYYDSYATEYVNIDFTQQNERPCTARSLTSTTRFRALSVNDSLAETVGRERVS